MKAFLYTAFALTAFAFNSILCRLALRGEEADAVGFTLVRLASGAAMLLAISYAAARKTGALKSGSWPSAFFLFAYATCFSIAYLDLAAGTGALILFGSVQMTMIVVALVRGERPRVLEWTGLIVAAVGLIYLVFPSLSSPPLLPSFLMGAAGAAWGFYTLRGKGSRNALADTTGNFVRSAPMIAALAVIMFSKIHLSSQGILLSALSGAVTSGIGYSLWYSALRHHTPFRAAVLQLPVPLLTALLGVALLNEILSTRLLIASGLILGGIGMTIIARPAASVARKREC